MAFTKTIKDIYEYRMMIGGLVHRDLRGRYKGSVLGFLWTFLNPLLQLAVYTLIFGVLFKSAIPDFYMFLFVGLIPWLFFSNCLVAGCDAVLEQKSLVTKVKFPREVLPIAHATTAFVNMLYCMIIVVAVVLINVLARFGMKFSEYSYLTSPELTSYSFLPWLSLPLLFLILYIMGLGVTLIFSATTVYFRDLKHIIGIISMLWMYCTPIMYRVENVLNPTHQQQFGWVFTYVNPLTVIIQGFQNVFYSGRWPDFSKLWVSVLWAFAFLLLGVLLFEKLKKRFAEEI